MSQYGSNSVLAQPYQGAQTNAPTPDVREGTVSAELRDLHAQLQALDDVTGKLRQRLDAVMVPRPVSTQAVGGGPANPISRCEVAGGIHAAVDLACNITAKCNDMLCCLEL